ncbi:hypothetical protein ACP6C7_13200 [Mycolicibacterium septicum]|uniref:Cullin, a subunit of E3 ubiquitin ligase n=1 Tax=Mycolicibacterium septicum TaxID=98668 RepID=A0ABW9LUE7_9MYCO
MDEQRLSPGSRPSPFLGSAAIAAGLLSAHDLRTSYRAVYRNVYLADDVALTPRLRARAAWLFAGPDAVLSGISAAAVHGVNWLDVNAPAEVVRNNRRAPDGIQVRSYALAPEDICDVDGMRVTTVARTIFDLGRLLPCADAVPVMDALINKSGIDRETVWSLADANPGIRGVDRLRMSLAQADGGAESPLQSRTRLLLRRTGIPGLQTQIPFYDQWGFVWNRAAMGWPRWKLAVECDEEKDSAGYRAWVHSHTAELESYDWTVLWVTESMVSGHNGIVERVRRVVGSRTARVGTPTRLATLQRVCSFLR